MKFKSEFWCSECAINKHFIGVGLYPFSLLETKRLHDDLGIRLVQTPSQEVFLLLPISSENYRLKPCTCGRMVRIEFQKKDKLIRREALQPLKKARSLSSRNRNGNGNQKNKRNQYAPR